MGRDRSRRVSVSARLRIATALASALLLVGAVLVTGSASGDVGGPSQPSCAEQGPVHVHRNPWPKARGKMAPRGARVVQLCRYADLNAHPSFELVGSDLVSSQRIRHQIISRLDALKPYSGPPPHCPADTEKEVGITLLYKAGHEVTVAVDLSGCTAARNGDITRPAANTRAGRRLLSQLKALTPRQQD